MRGLHVVVLDEVHTYAGFFGANMANVVRRLQRLCEHHGSRPQFICSSATVGNPHCVTLREEVSGGEARALGPHIETEPRFPNRTNVQFMKVLDRANVQIEVWERGAGYTLASGSSASASAAVAHRLGLCDGHVTVHMPGGCLAIDIDEGFAITMRGPVTRTAEGVIDQEAFGGAGVPV